MYPEQFGLKSRPFRAHATGAEVFVGPQTAGVLGAVKKALAVEDAVIAVSGPVGVGKSTVVRRALDAIGDNRIIVSIGRLQLGYDEVIELLLAGLGARQLPKSTVQRFAVFRRMLHQYAAQGTRIFIVVEDARSLGVSALSELEALTAEDAGASSGASLVLMGASGLDDLLRDPLLARLKQRIRLRHTLQPLGESELRAYLKHSFRLAGRDFEDVFDQGAAALLYRFSGGVPRVCNNLVDQVLTTAAEDKVSKVPLSVIERTAAEEIGLTTEHSVADIKDALAQAEVDKATAEADASAALPTAVKRETIDVDTGPATEAVAPEAEPISPPRAPEPVVAPAPVAEAEPAAATAVDDADDDIPELIQDTLPDLEVLAPALAAAGPQGDSAPETEPEPAELDEPEAVIPELALPEVEPPASFDPDVAAETTPSIPTLAELRASEPGPMETSEPEPPVLEDPVQGPVESTIPAFESPTAEPVAPEPAIAEPGPGAAAAAKTDIPDWERDPTLAELRPDLDALDRAMSYTHSSEEPAPPVIEEAPPVAEPPSSFPEITLDREIQAKIDEATEALRATEADIPTLEELEAEDNQSLEASITEADLVEPLPVPVQEPAAPARDKAELDKIATELSKARSLEDVDDKMAETLFGEEFSIIAAEVAAVASANDDMELENENVGSGEATGTDGNVQEAAASDTSPSQRLATLRSLNNNAAPAGAPPTPQAAESIVMSTTPASNGPQASGPKPDSIEEQMNTSMTQTLKALNARGLEDDESEEKKGFFSRFRRS